MEVNERSSIISRLQSRVMKIDDFNWDRLMAPPLYSLLPQAACYEIYRIATSVRYSGNARLRYQKIDEILTPYGFTKKGAGTNRVVYKYLENDNFLLKVATDDVGVKDNPAEFKNQFIYKPFVTKIFEVDPTGAVALVERVVPITSREEFLTVASNIFEVINCWFIGDYIMADIGTKFFMNWGIRKGFGPVLLDFPYVYELDGNKLYCTAPDKTTGCMCGGVIDYDDGFNFLYCSKCGNRYLVKSLAKAVKDKQIIMKGGKTKMQVITRKGDRIINSTVTDNSFKEETDSVKKNTAPDRSKEVGKLVAAGKFVPVKKNNNNFKKNDNNNRRNQQQNNNNLNHNRDHHRNGANNRGIVRSNDNIKSDVQQAKDFVEDKSNNTLKAEFDELNNKYETVKAGFEEVKTENDSLKEKIAKVEADLKTKEEELEGSYKDYDTIEEALNAANVELKELREKNETLEKQYSELVDVMDSVADNASNNGPESEMYKDLMAKYDSVKHKLETAESNIDEKDEKIKDLEAVIEEQKKDIAEKTNQYDQLDKLFNELSKARECSEEDESEEEDETPYVDIPFNPAEDVKDASEEKAKAYLEKLDAVDGIRSLVCELTTVNTLNFSKGKELLGEDEYVLVVKGLSNNNLIVDGNGNNYCISKIGSFIVPTLFEDKELFTETSRKVELARSLPTTS